MARRRRLRPTRASRGGRVPLGYSLVEVVIAMLLTAIMATALFSVVLTAKTGGNQGDRKFQAMMGARQVSSRLRNYVTADHTINTKPKGPGKGANPWSMTSIPDGITDTVSSSCVPDANPNCYALAPGVHTVTGLLSSEFQITYTVEDIPGGAKKVTITTTWETP